ncbi:MAG: hypothetical protein OCD02_08885 [Spirochaetaceae bacterium]
MDKKSNNSNNLKSYTRELRDLVLNNKITSLNDLTILKNKHKLEVEDLDKIDELANLNYDSAKNDFEFGDWNKALTNIEEAMYKTPFNSNILELYYMILAEKNRVIGDDSTDLESLDLVIKKIKIVDKKLYRKLKKLNNNKVKKKIKKLWLLIFLLPIIIMLFVIFVPKQSNNITTNYSTNSNLSPGEIKTEVKKFYHTSEPHIVIIESKMNQGTNNFLHELSFEVVSETENILYLEGFVKWFDKDNNILINEKFSTPQLIEYYKNETIPFSITKSALRNSPNISLILIEITKIESAPGKEREKLKPLEFILPINIKRKIEIHEIEYTITTGVTSNYLTFAVLLSNKSKEQINIFEGQLEWYDEFNILKYAKNIKLMTKKDLPLKFGEKRVIYKIFELDGVVTQNYRFNILDIN